MTDPVAPPVPLAPLGITQGEWEKYGDDDKVAHKANWIGYWNEYNEYYAANTLAGLDVDAAEEIEYYILEEIHVSPMQAQYVRVDVTTVPGDKMEELVGLGYLRAEQAEGEATNRDIRKVDKPSASATPKKKGEIPSPKSDDKSGKSDDRAGKSDDKSKKSDKVDSSKFTTKAPIAGKYEEGREKRETDDYLESISVITHLNFIDIPAHIFARIINAYVKIGSHDTGVSYEDVKVKMLVDKDGKENDPKTVAEALDRGAQIIDIIYWFKIAHDHRPKITFVTNLLPPQTTDPTLQAKALAYYYFFLMVRGHPPAGKAKVIGRDVPAFLTKILGMTEEPQRYANRICSFDLKKIPTEWIKTIDLKGISGKMQNRFALGLAGFRWLHALLVLTSDQEMGKEEQHGYDIAVKLASLSATWEMHAATRDPRVIEHFGSLNHELQNIFLAAFSKDVLDVALKAKLIPVMPISQPNNKRYKKWSEAHLAIFTSFIFKKATARI